MLRSCTDAPDQGDQTSCRRGREVDSLRLEGCVSQHVGALEVNAAVSGKYQSAAAALSVSSDSR